MKAQKASMDTATIEERFHVAYKVVLEQFNSPHITHACRIKCACILSAAIPAEADDVLLHFSANTLAEKLQKARRTTKEGTRASKTTAFAEENDLAEAAAHLCVVLITT
jgi:hypothetical protein